MSMSDRCLQSCQHLQQTCAILHHPYKECNVNNITMWQHVATISGIYIPYSWKFLWGRIFHVFHVELGSEAYHFPLDLISSPSSVKMWFLSNCSTERSIQDMEMISPCTWEQLQVSIYCTEIVKYTLRWFHPARESNCKYQYTAQRWLHPARESNCKYQYTAQR